MENRYNVKDKGLELVIEELKQRVMTLSELRRYEARIEQYTQNKMFQTNQVKFFKRLKKEKKK